MLASMGGPWFGPLPRLLKMVVSAAFGRQKIVMCMAKVRVEDLNVICELIDPGKVRPVIDGSYSAQRGGLRSPTNGGRTPSWKNSDKSRVGTLGGRLQTLQPFAFSR